MVQEIDNREVLWEILIEIKNILDECNVPFFVTGGTLLGFIRDKDMIKWDHDVDLGVMEEYKKLIDTVVDKAKNLGWITNSFCNDNVISFTKDKYKREGYSPFHLDIFIFHRCKNKVWNAINMFNNELYPEVYPQTFFEKFDHIVISNIDFNVPYNPEKFLQYSYGSKWNVPQSDFSIFQKNSFKQGYQTGFISQIQKIKINPLLVILSPRDIPFAIESLDKIDYVDKLWIKYYPSMEAYQIAYDYFIKHEEYTHLIINCDDAIVPYNHIAMLIADIKKYNFPVIAGCCCMDKVKGDMNLSVTLNRIAKSMDDKVTEKSYHLLPNKIKQLRNIIQVWFQGNALVCIKRELLKLTGLAGWKNHPWAQDLRLAYELARLKVPQYVDLRCYMEHFKLSQFEGVGEVLVGKKTPYIKFVPATRKVPIMKPAKVIKQSTVKKLFKEYFEDVKIKYKAKYPVFKICIVMDTNPNFVWVKAFKKYVKNHPYIIFDSVFVDFDVITNHSINDSYWNPIKNADIVFIYLGTRNHIYNGKCWEWYVEIPKFVKQIANPAAKIIIQFDDELNWMFNVKNKLYNLEMDESWLEEKAKDKNKIIREMDELVDAHFIVSENPLYVKYCRKPVYYMPLPQLEKMDIPTFDVDLINNKTNNIALLQHRFSNSSVLHSLQNVTFKFDIPVVVFSGEKNQTINCENYNVKEITNISRSQFLQKLREEIKIALDDNENYIGWSQFAFECAVLGVPVIGSTKAVKEFFPDLYTKHKDYNKQIFLINKLLKDKQLYLTMARNGYHKAVFKLNSEKLCDDFLTIARTKLKCKFHILTEEQIKELKLIRILQTTLPHHIIPKCPAENQTIYDDYSHTQLNRDAWFKRYGEFADIINDDKKYREVIRKALNSL